MEWSGRAPALPATRQGARSASEATSIRRREIDLAEGKKRERYLLNQQAFRLEKDFEVGPLFCLASPRSSHTELAGAPVVGDRRCYRHEPIALYSSMQAGASATLSQDDAMASCAEERSAISL